MAVFAPGQEQPDEGYSEDPLNPSFSSAQSLSLGGPAALADLPAWMLRHLPHLSLAAKKQLAMAILDHLPTSAISEIVTTLHPRLYIDFVQYLPPEVCLKILEYLDPVSLINVAQACRAWYTLAYDRKLWERLYHLEGWNVIPTEIQQWQERVNRVSAMRLERMRSEEGGHAYKKRAILHDDDDGDYEMSDAGKSIRVEEEPPVLGNSIFGSPAWSQTPSFKGGSLPPVDHSTPGSQDVDMDSSDKGKGVERAVGFDFNAQKEESPMPTELKSRESMFLETVPHHDLVGLPLSTLWIWEPRDAKYIINWKYLYSTRRRLEANWELGKYTNFQFPHADHPEEGHQECVYSLQFTPEYLVSGSRDRTIRIWSMRTRRLMRPPLVSHAASVLCLQFDADPDEDLIVSGSSDSDVILWRFSTGQVMQRLRKAHSESVLNVKFDKRILVTCSKDKSIKIFNRRPLRYGDMGYPNNELVNPVPRQMRSYGYDMDLSQELPVIAPYTMIGSLHGHRAAVNAVHICNDEIVSASGDKGIKVWNWPKQLCTRTILGHNKGIACVQYDGRRIVSGSSDNEVKVFDSSTGLEVASLAAHTNLVRTVQAGFGDLPYSREEDKELARKVDEEYFKAVEAGDIPEYVPTSRHNRRPRNAGSMRPQDITAYGANLPPGGGGGKYARIVSGSYDQCIIIWRRDKEGIWKDVHRLRQDEAAAASRRPPAPPPGPPDGPGGSGPSGPPGPPGPSLHPSMRPSRPSPSQGQSQGQGASQSSGPQQGQATSRERLRPYIDMVVPRGPQALEQALAATPSLLTCHSYLNQAIDQVTSPFARNNLRQVVERAMAERANQTARQPQPSSGPSTSAASQAGSSSSQSTAPFHSRPVPVAVPVAVPAQSQSQPHQQSHSTPSGSSTPNAPPVSATGPVAATTDQNHPAVVPMLPVTAHAQGQGQDVAQGQDAAQGVPPGTVAQQAHHHHPHIPDDANPARVFKLQFDARRIICCSQTSVIVGWDFCNSDSELEAVARFFAPVE